METISSRAAETRGRFLKLNVIRFLEGQHFGFPMSKMCCDLEVWSFHRTRC